uniref:Uncharacterized protein n=1 Tax=Leersia perrieri TaxID=77586 RepID=A0A0D9WMJ7_9ORYZ
MASSSHAVAPFLLIMITLCAVVSVHSSRPIGAAERDGGIIAGAARSLPERSMIVVLPRNGRREPMFRPPSPKANTALTSFMPPCSGAGPGCNITPGGIN